MKKSELSRLGMQEEFSNWIKSRPKEISVGSRVRVKSGSYGISSIGSEGIVLGTFSERELCVKFHKLTGVENSTKEYIIYKMDLELI